jgi:hypothetical protein
MTLRKKIIIGALALTIGIGMSSALPTRARADSDDWRHHDHHAWRWHHHHRDWDDYHRGYRDYPQGPAYGYHPGYIPRNGEGMISRDNPNFYWACDGDGHHCHWARR